MSTQPEDIAPRRAKRSGGRAARQALRAAPLAEDIRPVRAGMDGGLYRPLSDAEVQRIHQAALQAMEEIGMSIEGISAVESWLVRPASGRPDSVRHLQNSCSI